MPRSRPGRRSHPGPSRGTAGRDSPARRHSKLAFRRGTRRIRRNFNVRADLGLRQAAHDLPLQRKAPVSLPVAPTPPASHRVAHPRPPPAQPSPQRRFHREHRPARRKSPQPQAPPRSFPAGGGTSDPPCRASSGSCCFPSGPPSIQARQPKNQSSCCTRSRPHPGRLTSVSFHIPPTSPGCKPFWHSLETKGLADVTMRLSASRFCYSPRPCTAARKPMPSFVSLFPH